MEGGAHRRYRKDKSFFSPTLGRIYTYGTEIGFNVQSTPRLNDITLVESHSLNRPLQYSSLHASVRTAYPKLIPRLSTYLGMYSTVKKSYLTYIFLEEQKRTILKAENVVSAVYFVQCAPTVLLPCYPGHEFNQQISVTSEIEVGQLKKNPTHNVYTLLLHIYV